ncbi:hypothetical protein [Lichenibacterium dinghuense]|uniref:hypothetical protein n=1 Tax=Lichenibacterium dinghuense TaxID=2895977 RepID=UPI001F469543|nr:hypothetical protein [Lichenibacterium sp. 6Y81]
MRRTILAAALACAAASPAAVRAQDWGGAAGVAAMRGYTASAGVQAGGPVGAPAPAPAEVEAVSAPSGTFAPARPVAGLAGDVPHRWRAAAARPRHGHRRLRRA